VLRTYLYMIRVPIKAISVIWVEDSFLVLEDRGKDFGIAFVYKDGSFSRSRISLKGKLGYILHMDSDNKIYLSIDSHLMVIETDKPKTIVKLGSKGNFIWSSVSIDDVLYVSEYGDPPTFIYRVKNGNVEKVISNQEIDISSRHFHQLAFDRNTSKIYVSLGDANRVRIAVSDDKYTNWRPFYTGVWQFTPIKILGDRLIAGMDSKLAKGGVGIFDLESASQRFIFFKDSLQTSMVQFCDLQYFNGIWIGGLGIPQAYILSKDLAIWHLIYLKDMRLSFDHSMKLAVGRDTVAIPMNNSLCLLSLEDLREYMGNPPIIMPQSAYLTRLKGAISSLKRRIIFHA